MALFHTCMHVLPMYFVIFEAGRKSHTFSAKEVTAIDLLLPPGRVVTTQHILYSPASYVAVVCQLAVAVQFAAELLCWRLK